MAIVWEKTSVYFRCEICGAEHTEPCDDDYQDRRAAIPRMRDWGWSVGHHQKVYCPDCTLAGNYDELPGG